MRGTSDAPDRRSACHGVGVGLIGFTFAEHVFSRSADAQSIADHYRSLMSAEGLHDLSSGFAAVQAAGGELGTKALPRLQQSLQMNDAQFNEQAPGIVKLVGPVIATMNAERADYARADQIPTGSCRSPVPPGSSWASAVCSSRWVRSRSCGRAPCRVSR